MPLSAQDLADIVYVARLRERNGTLTAEWLANCLSANLATLDPTFDREAFLASTQEEPCAPDTPLAQ